MQRTFTKHLPGLSNLSYADRLKTFQMQTLEHRRLQYDLHTCFNIVHNNNCLQPQTFFTFSPNTNTRGHQFRFVVPIAKTNIRKHFFSCRVVHPWNSLPSNLVTNPNLINFKHGLRRINLNKYLTTPSLTLQ